MRIGRWHLALWAGVLAVLLAWPAPMTADHGNTATAFSGPFPHFAPLFVADAKGLFKKHGLNVTVRLFDSGGAASSAFRGGRADYLAGCDFPTISLLQVEDVIVLAPYEHDSESIMISAREGIKNLADVKGKKVGIPLRSTSEFFTFRALKDVGLGPKDVEVVNLGPADMLPAVVRGDIDVASWWQPFGWRAEEASAGKVRTLVTAKGYYTLWCPMSARRKYVEAHPKETVAFLKALHEGTEWLNRASLDERTAFVTEYAKSDPKTTRQLISLLTYSMVETPEYRKSLREMEEFMLNAGLVKKRIEWDKVLGSKYLREVDPSLVK
ncbi:MAG: ABC transporter substrate-binding protein [Candidatus Rokubacteria bacterium]|nr:ABC transporter substrate-binding protein [Candidatus Rokubacteria bacterium]